MSRATAMVSREFFWRRVHSLMGLWLVGFLALHLTTNSQAALWIGDDGSGFVRRVNFLESLPFLQVIETVLIGVPFALHGAWGVKRIFEARMNHGRSDGSRPSLPYGRNRAFFWQRATSWILLVGVIAHVAQMRFAEAPKKVMSPSGEKYLTIVSQDEGLFSLAQRLKVEILTSAEMVPASLKSGDVAVLSPNPGTAMLLEVRDAFKNPWLAILYTIFVLSAAFHAFNGFWTFLITWGWILSVRSQRAMVSVSALGMIALAFLGLMAIWCSYWINLRN